METEDDDGEEEEVSVMHISKRKRKERKWKGLGKSSLSPNLSHFFQWPTRNFFLLSESK
jgi:hypothetical protein